MQRLYCLGEDESVIIELLPIPQDTSETPTTVLLDVPSFLSNPLMLRQQSWQQDGLGTVHRL